MPPIVADQVNVIDENICIIFDQFRLLLLKTHDECLESS